MTKTLHGKVHGKTIELDEDLGVAEGQEVEITIRSIPNRRPWGKGLRRCAGALASDWTEEEIVSWRQFTRIGNATRAGKSPNELLAGYQHLVCPPETSRRLDAPVHTALRSVLDTDSRSPLMRRLARL
jgi:hypothetical protein